MQRESAVVSIDELLEHRGWVTELARSLVRDVHRAEDAIQNTWIAALRNPPRKSESGRAWLGTVVRNFVRLGYRADNRRTNREQRTAQPEVLRSDDDPVEQLETQSAVIAAIRKLPPSSRDAIVLRYLQGLTPTEISARTGESYEAVKTQLRRGRDQLRQSLDQQYGDTQSWLPVLLPFTDQAWSAVATATTTSTVSSAAVTGGVFMSTKITAAAAAIALGFASYSWVLSSRLDETQAALAAKDREHAGLASDLDQARRNMTELDERFAKVSLREEKMAATLSKLSQAKPPETTEAPTATTFQPMKRQTTFGNLDDVNAVAQAAADRGDIETLWTLAAELIAMGEPGYEKLIELAHLVEGETINTLWRNEEVMVGPFFKTAAQHVDQLLDFGLYLDTKNDSELPKFMKDVKKEMTHEFGVVLLGFYDGENVELLDRYVAKFAKGLPLDNPFEGRYSDDMIRALGQIRTEASTDFLLELLPRADSKRWVEVVVQSLAWQASDRALDALIAYRRDMPADADLEVIDAAIEFLQ